MKKSFQIIGLALLVATTGADAQRKGNGKGKASGDRAVALREFSSVRGEFEAWKTAVLDAGSLNVPGGENLQPVAGEIYRAMNKSVEGERLSDSEFGKLGADYIRLVLAAPKQEEEAVVEKLAEFAAKAKESATGVIDAKTATPQVNRQQTMAQELLWFGIVTEKISSGKRSTIERKQKSLIALEEKAKSDKNVDDREREKLVEEATEIVRELMEALAS